MAYRSEVKTGMIEEEAGTASKTLMSGTPAMVGFIVLVALLFLIGVRNGFRGFIPSMS